MKILDFIFCEDVRREIGGKYSLMGIYRDRLKISSSTPLIWPIATKFGFYLRMKLDDNEAVKDRIRVIFIIDDEETARVDATGFDPNRPDPDCAIATATNGFSLKKPGLLKARIEIYKDDVKLSEKTIELLRVEEERKTAVVEKKQ